MNDKKLIIAGLIVLIAVAVLPFVLSFGNAAPAPEPELAAKAKAAGYCVLPKEEMKVEHMKILDQWRDSVVRQSKRIYISSNGKEFNMSLSSGDNSCIGCHSSKTQFCDKCHDYASVRPYCWNCHLEPEEK